jgi:hypothetical protein
MRKKEPKDCPFCGGSVRVRECGYTTFNPGSVFCPRCQWGCKLGWVNDRQHAVKKWNRAQKYVKRIKALTDELERLNKKAGL